MQLLNEIVETATADAQGLGVLLRKCLVLSYALSNTKLKEWTDKELNGYEKDDHLPEYRKLRVISKGFFVGIGGSQIRNQPLAMGILKPAHRRVAMTVSLNEPIAVYDQLIVDKD